MSLPVTDSLWRQRLESLFARHRSVAAEGFKAGAYNSGLEGMQLLDEAIGHPHREYPVIHVAGTNGKGSVCSMIASGLAGGGLKVGLYTSPHLVDFRERIKIITSGGFEMISREEALDFLDRYDRFPGLSFFEITTGMALRFFADRGVDAAVLETGLGGRLDSTNVVTPIVSVITSIGLDHCDLLGGTRAAIAFEKAGIFKPGVPALVWGRDEETGPVFERVAASLGAPLYFADGIAGKAGNDGAEGPTSPPSCPTRSGIPELDLQGPCQEQNYRTAIAALELSGAPFDASALSHAAAMTGLRARWETLLRKPLVICDIAHNPPALRINFERLRRLRTEAGGHRPLLVVFGIMQDKDIDSILPLLPADAEYFPVVPDTPRALSAEDLALKLKNLNFTPPRPVAAGVRAALDRASGMQDAVIYVGGSNYVASEAISYIESL